MFWSYVKNICKNLFGNWVEKQDKVSKDFIKGKIKISKGRGLEKYEQDMIEDYKKANINCLVVWDFQLVNDKINTYKRMNNL